MGMIVTGIVAAIAIAIGASYFVDTRDDNPPAWQVYSTSSARVGNPGHNLVGTNWTGLAVVDAAETVESETGEPTS